MKKRLRKKKNLKEFAILGVTFYVESDFAPCDLDAFWDSMIDHIESQNLVCCAAGDAKRFNVTLEPVKPSRVVSDMQVKKFENWLKTYSEVINIKISQKWDLNYAEFPEE